MNLPKATEITHAISVREPYATLLVSGLKTIENRSKPIGGPFPRWLAIHAASQQHADMTDMGFLEAMTIMPQTKKLFFENPSGVVPKFGVQPSIFAKSAIIGAVQLIDCVLLTDDESVDRIPVTHGPMPELARSGWAIGDYCWVVGDAFRLKRPVQCKGYAALFIPPHAALQASMDHGVFQVEQFADFYEC